MYTSAVCLLLSGIIKFYCINENISLETFACTDKTDKTVKTTKRFHHVQIVYVHMYVHTYLPVYIYFNRWLERNEQY